MNRKRFRYIDDECDYTFLFDIRDSYIKVIISNNDTECDVALIDLTGAAKEFYQSKMYELSHKNSIDRIKEFLKNRKVV